MELDDRDPPDPLALPVRLTLETRGRGPLFDARRPTSLAHAVFGPVARHPGTLAACLLPDRLDWLLTDGARLAESVDHFRTRSDRIARRHGHREGLWGRCRWSHLARLDRTAGEVAAGFAEAPRRLGLAPRAGDYPLLVLRVERAAARPTRAGSGASAP